MRAAVLRRAGDLAVRSLPEPQVGPGEVLVGVAWCGVCGTDRSIYRGGYGGRTLPVTLGHEFSGRIVQDPSGRLASGTPVVADINLTCGRCRACRLGDVMTCPDLRQVGVDCDGAFAPLLTVPARAVQVLPDDLSLDAAALTEPLACVLHAQAKLDWTPAGSVLVLGAGPAGVLHAQAARVRGSSVVLVADVRRDRLDAVDALEGVTALEAGPGLGDRVREQTGGRGVDVVVEATGNPAAFGGVWDSVRAGGQVLLFGIPAPDTEIGLHPHDVILRELAVRGSNGAGPAAWPVAVDLLAAGSIDVTALLAERIGLADVVERITAETDPGFKVLVSPQELAA